MNCDHLEDTSLIVSIQLPEFNVSSQLSLSVSAAGDSWTDVQDVWPNVMHAILTELRENGMSINLSEMSEHETTMDKWKAKANAAVNKWTQLLKEGQEGVKASKDATLKLDTARKTMSDMRDACLRECQQLREQVYQKDQAEVKGVEFFPKALVIFDPVRYSFDKESHELLQQKAELMEIEGRKKVIAIQERVDSLQDQLNSKTMLAERKDQLIQALIKKHEYGTERQLEKRLGDDGLIHATSRSQALKNSLSRSLSRATTKPFSRSGTGFSIFSQGEDKGDNVIVRSAKSAITKLTHVFKRNQSRVEFGDAETRTHVVPHCSGDGDGDDDDDEEPTTSKCKRRICKDAGVQPEPYWHSGFAKDCGGCQTNLAGHLVEKAIEKMNRDRWNALLSGVEFDENAWLNADSSDDDDSASTAASRGDRVKRDEVMNFNEDKEKEKDKEENEGDVLRVTVMSASGLLNKDGFGTGKSDPYVICQIKEKTGKTASFQTPVINDDLNPFWNHKGQVAGLEKDCVLEFQVWDKDWINSELLGKAEIPAAEIYEQRSEDFVRELRIIGEKGEDGGKLKVKLGKPITQKEERHSKPKKMSKADVAGAIDKFHQRLQGFGIDCVGVQADSVEIEKATKSKGSKAPGRTRRHSCDGLVEVTGKSGRQTFMTVASLDADRTDSPVPCLVSSFDEDSDGASDDELEDLDVNRRSSTGAIDTSYCANCGYRVGGARQTPRKDKASKVGGVLPCSVTSLIDCDDEIGWITGKDLNGTHLRSLKSEKHVAPAALEGPTSVNGGVADLLQRHGVPVSKADKTVARPEEPSTAVPRKSNKAGNPANQTVGSVGVRRPSVLSVCPMSPNSNSDGMMMGRTKSEPAHKTVQTPKAAARKSRGLI